MLNQNPIYKSVCRVCGSNKQVEMLWVVYTYYNNNNIDNDSNNNNNMSSTLFCYIVWIVNRSNKFTKRCLFLLTWSCDVLQICVARRTRTTILIHFMLPKTFTLWIWRLFVCSIQKAHKTNVFAANFLSSHFCNGNQMVVLRRVSKKKVRFWTKLVLLKKNFV